MPYHQAFEPSSLNEVEDRIKAGVYRAVAWLAATAWITREPVSFAHRREGRELPLRPGDCWSEEPFDCAWFHFTGTVPAEAAGQDVVLLIDLNGEGCVVDPEGRPVLGLTNASSAYSRRHGEPGKRVVPFCAPAEGGETVDLWVEAGANDLFGFRQDSGRLREAAVAIRNPQLHALQYDYEVACELVRHLPGKGARAARLHDALIRASRLLRECTEAEAAAARQILAPHLAQRGGDPSLTLSAIGHAHIDLAWLWPIRESKRKTARTFATAIALLDRYPEYVFGASQPQQYAWTKERHPQLYESVRRAAAEGRWEAQGAMWVEADTNLPSGESLIRQILYGKRFFREEFGKDPQCLWAPDCFGFSGALPQILAKSGVSYFMTQKLSWNQVTAYPHHTFWWHGIDGSRVLVHTPPEDTYNSAAGPEAVLAAEEKFLDKSVSDRCLMLFGIGDGGGGPGEEHLERLARERNLAGLCPVVQEPAEKFFAHIARDGERYATWRGELYLERHQGTYTTQAAVKRCNRRIELALRELEMTAAFAAQFAGAAYPREALERIWKEVLLYQFHDILPGSSIARVYDEAKARYAALEREIAALGEVAEKAICRVSSGGRAAHPVVVLNSLSWPRSEWLEIGGRWVKAEVPALGCAVVDLAAESRFVPPCADTERLENEKLRLLFNPDGSVASCFDKECGREVLLPGKAGNLLAVYRDDGDAWDIPMDYRSGAPERLVLEAAEAKTEGPRAALRHSYRYGGSRLWQEVVLHACSRRIDFVTSVDWQECRRMLRTSFPVAVSGSEAVCGIQFGAISRPTHRNTLADAARFEVCAHKWVDLSDRGYGAALLNDCKYGHHLADGLLDLNLLRSPEHPDPTADRGTHSFVYSLLPHAGDHVEGGVVRAAYELNAPLRAISGVPGGGERPTRSSWLSLDAPNVVIETVKAAEDGDGLVLRIYEAAGASTTTHLRCGFGLAAASAVNLIEEGQDPIAIEPPDALPLFLSPYEIRTLRLVPAA